MCVRQAHISRETVSITISLLQIRKGRHVRWEKGRVISSSGIHPCVLEVRNGSCIRPIDMWCKSVTILLLQFTTCLIQIRLNRCLPLCPAIPLSLSYTVCSILVVVAFANSPGRRDHLSVGRVNVWSGLFDIWVEVCSVIWFNIGSNVRSCREITVADLR